jgi:EAL domain-containing protein (putative c-di-GMP-specific phosphodiesterase class I)
LEPERKQTLELDPKEAERRRRALREARRGRPPAAGPEGPWLLESLAQSEGEVRRMRIEPVPFRIGRLPGLELVLPSEAVSKRHAEIYERDGRLRIRDLDSTNGTFVNHEPIKDIALSAGDVLHFVDFEFRIARQETAGVPPPAEGERTVLVDRAAIHRSFHQGQELKELLQQGAVTMAFQPILSLPAKTVVAYEALGRGRFPGLPESPLELFRVAESVGEEVALSQLFRRKAVELVRQRPEFPTLFLNTHPSELEQPGLVESLEELRTLAPQLDLTVEIHESTLALPDFIGELRTKLLEINVGLAYDDFGAGQARLFELAEAPPQFLKFDRRFVSGVDHASTSRRRLLASLVAAARELLVKTVAEGVETAGEAEICAEVGFTHGQGYFYGRPIPVESL